MRVTDRTYYFAYGSNMSLERLTARVPSAERLCVAILPAHVLKFHKHGKSDGSGKCDAAFTGDSEDRVFGALYSVQTNQMRQLDRFEGLGYGYARKTVSVHTLSGETFGAETYIATIFDSSLRPLDWYKEHVLRGARSIGLPNDYVASIEVVVADVDTNEKRRATELAIYV